MLKEKLTWKSPWLENRKTSKYTDNICSDENYDKDNPYIEQNKFNNLSDFYNKMYMDKHHKKIKSFIDYPAMVCTNDGKILVYMMTADSDENKLVPIQKLEKYVINNYINEIYRKKDKEMIKVLEENYIKTNILKVVKLGKYYKIY